VGVVIHLRPGITGQCVYKTRSLNTCPLHGGVLQYYYSADLLVPYGRSPPVYLTRGTKQGNILSPLLFNLLFNGLLHALRRSGVGVRTVSGLRTPCRVYADDLGLVLSSEQGTNKLLQVIASFCGWNSMRVNLRKTFIIAYDFHHFQPLSTDNIRYQGFPLCHLPARESFPYLGVSAALVGKRGRKSLCVRDQKLMVRSETLGLKQVAAKSSLSPFQLVPAMRMMAGGKFAYSAGPSSQGLAPSGARRLEIAQGVPLRPSDIARKGSMCAAP
jgi:hypothetical protein